MNKKFLLLFIFLVGFSKLSICLPPPPPPPGGGDAPGCWPPPCVPVDGGISLLIAAGVIYGGKKLHNIKYRKNNS